MMISSALPSSYNGVKQADYRKYPQTVSGTTVRDFSNAERYQNRQPSIYNLYFGINLISAVDKLPPLSTAASESVEANLQENKTETKGVAEQLEADIQHKVYAYHHEIDRLNQDVEINQYTITNVLLGRGAHSTVKMAKCKEGSFVFLVGCRP